MKKAYWLASALICGMVAFSTVFAAEFVNPADDPNVTIGADEQHRNLYTAGANVTVNAPTQGDLVVAGSTVSIDGDVEDDLMAAGGTVVMNRTVGGDARVAGGNVTINGRVAGDLLVAGGNVTINSEIGGDLILAGGNAVVNGRVAGMVRVGGGNVTLNSRVEGEVRANVAEKLTFGPRADIPSKVFYRSSREAEFQNGSNVPNHEFSMIERRDASRNAWGILTAAFLLKLLAWVAAAWLWLHFRRRRFAEIVESVRRDPWSNLGIGAASLILIPIAIVILLLLVVGYYLAALVGVAFALVILAANLISALVLGELVLRYLNKPGEGPAHWQVVVLGVVLWQLLGFIPVLGWIIKLLLFLAVFGAIIRLIRTSYIQERS